MSFSPTTVTSNKQLPPLLVIGSQLVPWFCFTQDYGLALQRFSPGSPVSVLHELPLAASACFLYIHMVMTAIARLPQDFSRMESTDTQPVAAVLIERSGSPPPPV